MLYIGVAVGLNVLALACVVWYYEGQIRNVIHDQRLASDPVPLYPWGLVRNCLITPLVLYYMSASFWLGVAVKYTSLWEEVNQYFDSIELSLGALAPAGVALALLGLLALLPAYACTWLERWLEKKYRNLDRDTGEHNWHRASLTVVS